MDAQIPDHALLLKREVMQVTRLGRTALANSVRKGLFPKPIRLSERYIAWRREDVVAWLKNCPETDEVECRGESEAA